MTLRLKTIYDSKYRRGTFSGICAHAFKESVPDKT